MARPAPDLLWTPRGVAGSFSLTSTDSPAVLLDRLKGRLPGRGSDHGIATTHGVTIAGEVAGTNVVIAVVPPGRAGLLDFTPTWQASCISIEEGSVLHGNVGVPRRTQSLIRGWLWLLRGLCLGSVVGALTTWVVASDAIANVAPIFIGVFALSFVVLWASAVGFEAVSVQVGQTFKLATNELEVLTKASTTSWEDDSLLR